MKRASELIRKAKKIKLLAMDVDGVLTGGEIIILNNGEEIKIWSVKDRMGFAMLRASGLPIRLAWITARESKQVKLRAQDLKIDYLYQKSSDKWQAVQEIARKMKISPSEIAYVGDDLVDLKPLQNVGLSVCPPESHDILLKSCDCITKAPSGKGVVREVIELLIRSQGAWPRIMKRFAALLVSVSWLALSACSSQVPVKNQAERPDQWLEKFTITETSSGIPVWILNSATAQVYNKKKIATLENIRIQFMNVKNVRKAQGSESLMLAKKNQTQAARMSSPNGEVTLDTHDRAAWGGVEVETEDGTKLYAERLEYSTAKQMIYTDTAVKIVRKDSVLIGEGLEATPDLETVKIFRHQASLYPKQLGIKSGE